MNLTRIFCLSSHERGVREAKLQSAMNNFGDCLYVFGSFWGRIADKSRKSPKIFPITAKQPIDPVHMPEISLLRSYHYANTTGSPPGVAPTIAIKALMGILLDAMAIQPNDQRLRLPALTRMVQAGLIELISGNKYGILLDRLKNLISEFRAKAAHSSGIAWNHSPTTAISAAKPS